MGNSGGNEKKADQEFNDYISPMELLRKEHSENFGKDIDLYHSGNSKSEEELVLVIELTFDEDDNHDPKAQEALFKKFKEEINCRK